MSSEDDVKRLRGLDLRDAELVQYGTYDRQDRRTYLIIKYALAAAGLGSPSLASRPPRFVIEQVCGELATMATKMAEASRAAPSEP